MRRLLLAPLAVAALATGCSTFDSNVVARVDDAELTNDELGDLISALPTDAPEGSAELAREIIALWTRVEAVKSAYERDDIEVTDEVRTAAAERILDPAIFPGLEEMGTEVQDELVDWEATFVTLGDDVAYLERALADADVWVKPRYGQHIEDGRVLPLALPTTQAAG